MSAQPLSLYGALAVTRGGLREVVKRLAKQDGENVSTITLRHEVETIRHIADVLDAALKGGR